MSNRGHNENAIRLAALAGDAQIALDRVARGEADAIEGWLAYGAALNEGRALCPGDREFGQWVTEMCSSNLDVHPGEQQAAMWAAANADQFAEAKAAGNARTVRGIHAQWKKIEADRKKAEREAAEKAAREEREARAAEARKEADEQAEAARKAQQEARAAKDEDQRRKAEAKAAEEAEAAKAAEAAAAEAEAAAAPPEPEDPNAEARRALAGLTREGLEDEVIGLRSENADLRDKMKAAKAEIAALKERLANHTADDKDEVIRRQEAKLAHMKREQFNAAEKARIAIAGRRRAEDRVKELERLGVEIPL